VSDGTVIHEDAEDYLDAVPVGDGIAVRMAENVAATLADHVDRLIRFLETGETEQRRDGLFKRAASPDDVLKRMFPDAYRDSVDATAFRLRHAAALRDTTAARRVHARCAGAAQHVLSPAEADDWITTFAKAQFLGTPRKGRKTDPTTLWLAHVQDSVLSAMNTGLFPTIRTHGSSRDAT
jgi:hypothetical protein